MSSAGHQAGYFLKMQRHGLGIAIGHDKSGTDPAFGTDGADNIGIFETLVLCRPRAGSPLRPAPRDVVLLADPRFILPPQLYGRALRQGCLDLFQPGGEVFLNASSSRGSWAGFCGRALMWLNPRRLSSRLMVVSSIEMANSS